MAVLLRSQGPAAAACRALEENSLSFQLDPGSDRVSDAGYGYVLFVIDERERGLVTLVEAAESVGAGRRVFLVVDELAEGLMDAHGERIQEHQWREINAARAVLRGFAARQPSVRLFTNVHDAAAEIRADAEQRRKLGLDFGLVAPAEGPESYDLARRVKQLGDEIQALQRRLLQVNESVVQHETERQRAQDAQRAGQLRLSAAREHTVSAMDARNAARAALSEAVLRSGGAPALGALEGATGGRPEHEPLRARLRAAEKALEKARVEEDAARAELDALRREFASACAAVTNLIAERREMRDRINDKYAGLRAVREESHARRDAWMARQREERLAARELRDRSQRVFSASRRPTSSLSGSSPPNGGRWEPSPTPLRPAPSPLRGYTPEPALPASARSFSTPSYPPARYPSPPRYTSPPKSASQSLASAPARGVSFSGSAAAALPPPAPARQASPPRRSDHISPPRSGLILGPPPPAPAPPKAAPSPPPPPAPAPRVPLPPDSPSDDGSASPPPPPAPASARRAPLNAGKEEDRRSEASSIESIPDPVELPPGSSASLGGRVSGMLLYNDPDEDDDDDEDDDEHDSAPLVPARSNPPAPAPLAPARSNPPPPAPAPRPALAKDGNASTGSLKAAMAELGFSDEDDVDDIEELKDE